MAFKPHLFALRERAVNRGILEKANVCSGYWDILTSE